METIKIILESPLARLSYFQEAYTVDNKIDRTEKVFFTMLCGNNAEKMASEEYKKINSITK